jgi:tetratricopeptide (TPR) repeat protein
MVSMKGLTHFELINEGPGEINDGDSVHISTEAMWDSVLSMGKKMFIVSGDDAHSFIPGKVTAGRTWVTVRSPGLNARDITESIKNGNCYVSTGPVITDIKIENSRFTVTTPAKCKIEFIGTNGRILETYNDTSAIHTLDSGQIYTRARITDDSGLNAWTQPVFMKKSAVYKEYEDEVSKWLPLFMSGEENYFNGDFDEAVKAYEDGLALLKKGGYYRKNMGAAIYTRLGTIMGRLNKKKQAIEHLNLAIDLAPSPTCRLITNKELWALTRRSPDPDKPVLVCKARALGKRQKIKIDGIDDEKIWQQIRYTDFTAFREWLKDMTRFKICYDSQNLYIIARAEKSDTSGMHTFRGKKHENISFHFDVSRYYLEVKDIDNFSPGVSIQSKAHSNQGFYLIEYKIPVHLLELDTVSAGAIWGFNAARTHQKFSDKEPGKWSSEIGNWKMTGWVDKGGEAYKAPYLGLLVFE